ncbi:hypothetical protein OGAPHI_001253 [Ogataea philodendri]|uniref:AMP-activated protein kinase glycogen-binding domain-containing protein n=1 Tax=Ogataea philodendri TaxID=1378263 RepID=A0A9P8PED9_9ASCO|nr:uncharacterized protein OGAPHI_001253 [Ogataea philodendri]KAH3670738.1 hypothetical protein OGAPHI_001253 [Ogataea philodendri]
MYCIEFQLSDQDHVHGGVYVAGSFNEWSSSKDKLEFDPLNGVWKTTLKLDKPVEEGTKLMYKFVVDNEQWVCSPDEPREPDESGIENNVLVVTDAMLEQTHQEPDSADSSGWVDVGKDRDLETKQVSSPEQPKKQPKEQSAAWILSMVHILDSLKWFFKYYLVSLFAKKGATNNN